MGRNDQILLRKAAGIAAGRKLQRIHAKIHLHRKLHIQSRDLQITQIPDTIDRNALIRFRHRLFRHAAVNSLSCTLPFLCLMPDLLRKLRHHRFSGGSSLLILLSIMAGQEYRRSNAQCPQQK